MKRLRLYGLLGIGLLGMTTGCGSSSGGRYVSTDPSPRGATLAHRTAPCQSCQMAKHHTVTPAYVNQPAHRLEEMAPAEEVVVVSQPMVDDVPEAQEIVPTAAAEMPAAQTSVPVTSPYRGAASAPISLPAPPASTAAASAPPAMVQHVVPSRSNLPGEPMPTRRAIIDITAATCFAKADDYSWLQGQVEYSRLSKSWRLRYASVDEVDKFGGSVTLTGDVLDDLKDGQYLRVRGYLPNPDARGIAPAYRVEAIEAVEQTK